MLHTLAQASIFAGPSGLLRTPSPLRLAKASPAVLIQLSQLSQLAGSYGVAIGCLAGTSARSL